MRQTVTEKPAPVSGRPAAHRGWRRRGSALAHGAAAALVLAACSRGGAVQVAVGVEASLARPLLHEFAEQEQATLDQTQAEGAEVIWDRDPERVLRDAAAGELAPLPASVTAGRQPPLVDPQRRWAAVAAIGRVIVYDPDRLADEASPTHVLDLARPENARQLVLADPSRGDGLWHAAALFAGLGDGQALAFFRALRQGGARIVADEDAVVAALTAGEQPLALLDSDHAYLVQAALPRLVITIPDQGDGSLGVFVVPSVVAVTTRGAGNERALALAEFLLAAPQVFRIALTSNAFVVAADGKAPPSLLNVGQMKLMPVVYGELAEKLPAVRATLKTAFSGQLESRAEARPS
jgi:ABC-type Fe3+ transport system substrate-binding protein